jgi:glycosyl transferase family 25
MPVMVVNMARSTERWQRAQARLAALGLSAKRIEAVDGAMLPDEERVRLRGDCATHRWYFDQLSAAEFGCYASHLRCAQHLLDMDWPRALVLEDDFVADERLPAVLEDLASPELDYDIVKLHSGRLGGHVERELGHGCALVRHSRVPMSTVAYVISRAGAEKLLLHALPVRRPIDVQMKYWWEMGMKVRHVRPSLVDQDRTMTGTIAHNRCYTTSVRVRRLAYTLHYSTIRLLHSLSSL